MAFKIVRRGKNLGKRERKGDQDEIAVASKYSDWVRTCIVLCAKKCYMAVPPRARDELVCQYGIAKFANADRREGTCSIFYVLSTCHQNPKMEGPPKVPTCYAAFPWNTRVTQCFSFDPYRPSCSTTARIGPNL